MTLTHFTVFSQISSHIQPPPRHPATSLPRAGLFSIQEDPQGVLGVPSVRAPHRLIRMLAKHAAGAELLDPDHVVQPTRHLRSCGRRFPEFWFEE